MVFQNWLTRMSRECSPHVKIGYQKWTNDYSEMKNISMDMCSSDWIFILDSDEMITIELANSLKEKLANLPNETLVLRMARLILVDDRRCFTHGLWKPGIRPARGEHGRVLKRGSGRWTCRIHEFFEYPGRSTIPWNSPVHPKKDWHGQYFIHLWFYKDNPLKRWPDDINEVPEHLKGNDIWRSNTDNIAKLRGWKTIDVPKGVTWQLIQWKMLDLEKLRVDRKGGSRYKHIAFGHRLRKKNVKQNN